MKQPWYFKSRSPLAAFMRRLYLHRKAVMLIRMEEDGKKYLAVHRCNWRGKVWTKWFEVVRETDEFKNTIPFVPNPKISISPNENDHTPDIQEVCNRPME